MLSSLPKEGLKYQKQFATEFRTLFKRHNVASNEEVKIIGSDMELLAHLVKIDFTNANSLRDQLLDFLGHFKRSKKTPPASVKNLLEFQERMIIEQINTISLFSHPVLKIGCLLLRIRLVVVFKDGPETGTVAFGRLTDPTHQVFYGGNNYYAITQIGTSTDNPMLNSVQPLMNNRTQILGFIKEDLKQQKGGVYHDYYNNNSTKGSENPDLQKTGRNYAQASYRLLNQRKKRFNEPADRLVSFNNYKTVTKAVTEENTKGSRYLLNYTTSQPKGFEEVEVISNISSKLLIPSQTVQRNGPYPGLLHKSENQAYNPNQEEPKRPLDFDKALEFIEEYQNIFKNDPLAMSHANKYKAVVVAKSDQFIDGSLKFYREKDKFGFIETQNLGEIFLHKDNLMRSKINSLRFENCSKYFQIDLRFKILEYKSKGKMSLKAVDIEIMNFLPLRR